MEEATKVLGEVITQCISLIFEMKVDSVTFVAQGWKVEIVGDKKGFTISIRISGK